MLESNDTTAEVPDMDDVENEVSTKTVRGYYPG